MMLSLFLLTKSNIIRMLHQCKRKNNAFFIKKMDKGEKHLFFIISDRLNCVK